MDLKELEANPKLLSLLLAHYNALDDLYDHCEKASNWDHENNDCKVHGAGCLLMIEKEYPNSSWDYIEWDASGECDNFERIATIPTEGHGMLHIWRKGQFTEWYF